MRLHVPVLSTTSALGALLAVLPMAPLHAAEQSAGPIEEVLVTARRREESLQDVPASVSVITNEVMFLTGNDSMEKLRDAIPNFQFASDMAFRSRTAVRGLGSDRSGAQTNGVGFFIDGVYQAGTARFNAPFFDVERIEVLKGPQGARYGRNAFAGVVNVVTRKPDNELRANFQTVVENQGGLEYAGLVAGPIIQDQLYGKLSFAHNESDGDYKQAITGRNILDSSSDFYNARVVWDATEKLSFDMQASRSDNDGVAFSFSETDGLQDLSENFLLRDDQTSGQDNDEMSVISTWNEQNFEVRNLLSFRDALTHLKVDGDVTRFDGILSVVKARSETWVDELRIQSTSGGPFNWLVGGEYYHAKGDAIFPTSFLPGIGDALGSPVFGFLNGVVSNNNIDSKSTVWSVFGEVSYEFFDRLELAVGLRYDDIDSKVFNESAGPAGGGGLGENFKDDELQPLFSARYSIDDHTSVYASAARGIREGGFNSSALTKDYGTFATDKLWSYEIGLKKVYPESGATFNIAAFYMDASVLNQAAIIVTDAGNLANGAITLGGAKSYGVELDTAMPLIAGIDWTFAMGVLDCTLDGVPDFVDRSPEFQQVAAGVRSGNECQDSAEWTFSTSLNGDWPIAGTSWSAFGSVTLSGKGEIRLTSDNGTPGRAGPLVPVDPAQVLTRTFRRSEEIQEPVYLLNLNAGVRDDNWTIVAFAENLTNQLYALDHFSHEGLCDSGICGLGAGKFITTLAPQRRYGIKLRYDL